MKSIKLNYFRSSNGDRNFGDELSPLIVELVANKKVQWSKVSECDMIALGSIFEGVIKKLIRRKIRLNFKPIHVWGSGFIESKKINNIVRFKKNFVIHAIRGELSRAKINLPKIALGDPGILSKYLIKKQKKKTKVLLMPHIVHRDCIEVRNLADTIKGVKIADLRDNPISILKKISAADIVISSSLHGLICADSLGVANIRLDLARGLKGGDYKFNDYNKSISKIDCRIKGTETDKEIKSIIDNIDFSYQKNIAKLCEELSMAFPKEFC